MGNVGHWATIEKFLIRNPAPAWVKGDDQYRVQAYDLYDAVYWAADDAFKIVMRGQEGDPVYVPSGRQVVDTAHRYMANGLRVVFDPEFGTEDQRANAAMFVKDFFAREEFFAKFSAAKLNGIKKGDWLWHIYADPNKSADRKVSIFELDPANYFPDDGGNVGSINRVIIAEPSLNDKGNTVINRLVYEKLDNGRIQVHEDICEAENWGQPGADMEEKVIRVTVEPWLLPEPIDTIPVYHIPNYYEPTFGWGSSEMRGIELLMRGINQSVTDEELALVLDGIGVYVTDAGAPLDENGEETSWVVAVGHVLELPEGKNFQRIQGVGSVTPYQDHLKYLHQQIRSTTGGNDITEGIADVQVAESGIALTLRMQPLLSRMAEKELIVTDRMKQVLFGLGRWFAAYERMEAFLDLRMLPEYEDKLPINRDKLFEQVVKMYTATPVPLISGKEARRILTEKGGFVFTDDDTLSADILKEQSEFQAQTADAIASRVNQGLT